jgi:hypothetical protein
MTKDKLSKNRKKINELCEENEIDSINSNRYRARSITVGTAFGGIVEISMRTQSGYMYAQLQPTEAIELIEQISAGIGVEVAMRPKVNFASWRGWEEVIEQRIGFDKIAWKGAAAWQLDGDKLEENLQLKGGGVTKQLLPAKEKKISKKLTENKNE